MSGKVEAVLKASSFHGFDEDGNRHTYQKGDIVYLSKEQFEGFADQFDLVEEEIIAETIELDHGELDDSDLGN